MFKANFPYFTDQVCPMNDCPELEHLIKCEKKYPITTITHHLPYHDIFSSDITKQAAVTKVFASLLEKREVGSANSTSPQCCPASPGECGDPCSTLCSSWD